MVDILTVVGSSQESRHFSDERFNNHPEEIRDIEIDNECVNNEILPQAVIVDGWHRYAAARWLFDQGKLTQIHCRYGGRLDVLEYLQGMIDELLEDIV